MKRITLMISGGLDSYIMYYYAKKNGFNPIPVWVNLGQPYFEKELNAIKKFEFYNEIIQLDFKDYAKNLQGDIIPGRNLLLGILGANYGEEVWIGALHGEWTGANFDKSFKFFEDTTKVLTDNFQMIRERTEMKTPFFHLTKAELIKWALNNGLTKEQLFKTSTCYDKDKINCGECPTCFKRYISFKLNGIEENYLINPLDNNYAKQMKQEVLENNKHLTRERREEYRKIFNIK